MAAPELIPIFPLSNVVLFPRLRVPLHIFEPRYRQMTQAALTGDRRIGMMAVLPDHIDDISGDPALFSVGCMGTIEDSHRLPDGRYNIVLLGTQRFRVTREQPPTADRLYRVAEVTLLDDPYPTADRALVATLRDEVIDLVDRVVRRTGRPEGIERSAFDALDDETLANSLANGLSFAPREKQILLEADGVRARFEQLASVLDFVLAAADARKPPDSGALH